MKKWGVEREQEETEFVVNYKFGIYFIKLNLRQQQKVQLVDIR